MISIAVSVYNTEKYLKRCVKSLLNQTYRDLEVVLVDDGSSDNSGTICDEFALIDNRVRVIHKSNGGEASARNVGLYEANGEFLMFCDSDDEYLPRSVETLLSAMTDDVNLALGCYVEVTGKKRRHACLGESPLMRDELVLRLTEPSPAYGIHYIMSVLQAKLFKLSIIRKYNLEFDEHFVVGNDSIFVTDYIKFCNTIIDTFEPMYIYYKYDLDERIQGMSWKYPDIYRLSIAVNNRRYGILGDRFPQERLSDIFSNTIGALIKAYAYKEHYINGYEKELEWIVNEPFLRLCAEHYKPKREQDSVTFADSLLAKDIESMLQEIIQKSNTTYAEHKYIRCMYQ